MTARTALEVLRIQKVLQARTLVYRICRWLCYLNWVWGTNCSQHYTVLYINPVQEVTQLSPLQSQRQWREQILHSKVVINNYPHIIVEVKTFKCLRNAIPITGNMFYKTNNNWTYNWQLTYIKKRQRTSENLIWKTKKNVQFNSLVHLNLLKRNFLSPGLENKQAHNQQSDVFEYENSRLLLCGVVLLG